MHLRARSDGVHRIFEDVRLGTYRWNAILVTRSREAREIGVNFAGVRFAVDLEDPLPLRDGGAVVVDGGALEGLPRFEGFGSGKSRYGPLTSVGVPLISVSAVCRGAC